MLKTAGLSSSGVMIILIVYRFLKTIKGKRLVSSCCGKKIEMGMDVEDMTPKTLPVPPMITRENPMKIVIHEEDVYKPREVLTKA